MGGAATGLDMTDALTVTRSMGVDPDIASALLAEVARGMVEGWNDGLPAKGEA